jgi:hypothetical protein
MNKATNNQSEELHFLETVLHCRTRAPAADFAARSKPPVKILMNKTAMLMAAFRQIEGRLIEGPEYPTRDEAAFGYNVAQCVFYGPEAVLNEGMELTDERKKEIELETLADLRKVMELPEDFDFGPLPWLYGKKATGFTLMIDSDTGAGRIIDNSTGKVTRRLGPNIQSN